MKKLYLIISLMFCAIISIAQNINVSAPHTVAVGEHFRLQYIIQSQNVKEFRTGNIPDGIDQLYGPAISEQSSFQMVNGHTSSSSSITYTYTLSAEKVGTYTIPAAHAIVNGKTTASPTWKIKVIGRELQNRPNPTNTASSGNDLFIHVSASKTHVHEQEPLLLTYKIYNKVASPLTLQNLEGKMPDLKGFHTQEIPLPQQKSFHLENINGRPYRCVTWSQYVMYPQMTGKLEIPSITFKGIVVKKNYNVDPFEALFNGGSGYIEVKKDIVAPAVDIIVDPLPQRPADFSGGVGKFSVSASLDKQTVAANDPVTLRVVVSGNGNLKLLKQPVIETPKDFDKYSPKSTDKTKLTANGLEGSMVYDYLFVPRIQGDFTIPAVKFTYYDTQENAYKTITTKPLQLHVTPGNGGSGKIEDYSEKDQDIHGLKLTDDNTFANDIIFGSGLYTTAIIVTLIAFVMLLWIFRQRAIANADIVGSRGRKANKVATKRLKRAAKLMHQHKESEFYDEVLRALWGYVGDKLNMPVSELSRENISDQLTKRNVNADIISTFVDAIDECEYARYAPGEARGKMNSVYEKAMNGITNIDDFLKGGKKNGNAASANNGQTVSGGQSANAGQSAKMILILCLSLLGSTIFANAATKKEADEAYAKGNYQFALNAYEQITKTKPSAENFYNLGNAYFRSENITKALIAYNKAALIAPADKDIRHNLQTARNRTIDKMQPRQNTFIVAGWQTFVDTFNTNTWAYISLLSLIAVVLLTLTYIFAEAVILRQLGFFGGIVLFVVFVLSNICAYSQYSRLTANDGAIIVTDVCLVKKTPEKKAVDETTIHEGTHLRITDESIKGWYEVVLDDGTEGWIEDSNVERIIIQY